MNWNCVIVYSTGGRVYIEHWTLTELPRRSDEFMTEFRVDGDKRRCVATSAIRTMELRPIL